MTYNKFTHTHGARPSLLRPSRAEFGLMLLAAAGYFLAFPNPLAQIPPMALLMPACILWLSLTQSSRTKALFQSFLCLFAGSSLALYWLAIPMREFAGVPWPLAACFVMLLGVYIGLYGAAFSLLLRFLTRYLGLWLGLAASALGWGALELVRGWFLTGFPWLSLSSSFVGWPIMAQGSALFGMYSYSAVYAFIALLLAAPVMPGFLNAPTLLAGSSRFIGSTQTSLKDNRLLLLYRRLSFIIPALAIFGALLAYGSERLDEDWNAKGPQKIVVMSQGNIAQSLKWDQDMRALTIRRYLSLSEQAVGLAVEEFQRSPDLMIWPETAMPFPFQPGPDSFGSGMSAELSRPVRAFAQAHGVPLLFGAQAVEFANGEERAYNRVWLLDENGSAAGSYDKEHLVPFGEYIPPGLYVPFASEFLQGTGFTPGSGTPEALRTGVFTLGLLICYEVIFPELAQTRVAGDTDSAGANLLVSVSNDAWFGKSSAPMQHLQLAAQRCIEQGRYMARATNTGVSAIIDPSGRIIHPSPLFKSWAQAEQVTLLEERTFYHRNYRAMTTGLLALAAGMIVLAALKALLEPRKKPRI
ncbi:apolipoprotein N-acyltransferase [Desulfovibrio sp. OttesenSCG-928-C06]|nr:apolipoprotein N-acyltransferase [Desulfovibrio sp. OttesenSCG-928-C06]